jgi:hypothetical protein
MLSHLCCCFETLTAVWDRSLTLPGVRSGITLGQWIPNRSSSSGSSDALLVALFFLFRVLPWSRPGPWRAIWLIAGMTSILFIASELVALATAGTALAIVHQIPLFGAIFAVTTGFILTYLGGQRVTERALTLSETDELTQLGNARAFDLQLADLARRRRRLSLVYLDGDGLKKANDR